MKGCPPKGNEEKGKERRKGQRGEMLTCVLLQYNRSP